MTNTYRSQHILVTPRNLGAHTRNFTQSTSYPTKQEEEKEAILTPVDRNLFPMTPIMTREETFNLNSAQIMTARKSSLGTMSSAKRLDTIQRNIFTPLRNQKMSIASTMNYTNEENFLQPSS